MKTIGANSAESTEGVITNKQKGRDKPKLIPLTKIKYNPPQRYLFHSPKRKTKLQPQTCTNLTTNQLYAKRQQFPDNCKGHDGKDGHHHGQEKNKGHNIQHRYLFHSPKRKTKLQPQTCTNLTTNQLNAKRQGWAPSRAGKEQRPQHKT